MNKYPGFWSLCDGFYQTIQPQLLEHSHLIHQNKILRQKLLPDLSNKDFISLMSGGEVVQTTSQITKLPAIASIYAGYQFGHFNPQLGDGRSCLIGLTNNYEISLKGAGSTPYSRNGDGRAVLRSSIREYLCSHAMDSLNIPTTLCLSLVGSSSKVYREQIETGAIISRVAKSHIRFGHFELFASRAQFAQVKILADFVIDNYHKNIKNNDNKYLIFLEQIVKNTAIMIAKWQAVGFSHGVMNTDNMSILGLTLDYGPFGFLETYDPNYICNHSDHEGRYAFGAQPQVALWNLSKLAQALASLIKPIAASQILEKYQGYLVKEYSQLMRAKLGLFDKQADDNILLNDFLNLLYRHKKDYTNSFRELNTGSNLLGEAFNAWFIRYQQRLNLEIMDNKTRLKKMNKANPAYVLRNHLVQVAINEAQQGDYSEIGQLFDLLSKPFELKKGFESYQQSTPKWAENLSISCSS